MDRLRLDGSLVGLIKRGCFKKLGKNLSFGEKVLIIEWELKKYEVRVQLAEEACLQLWRNSSYQLSESH